MDIETGQEPVHGMLHPRSHHFFSRPRARRVVSLFASFTTHVRAERTDSPRQVHAGVAAPAEDGAAPGPLGCDRPCLVGRRRTDPRHFQYMAARHHRHVFGRLLWDSDGRGERILLFSVSFLTILNVRLD